MDISFLLKRNLILFIAFLANEVAPNNRFMSLSGTNTLEILHDSVILV